MSARQLPLFQKRRAERVPIAPDGYVLFRLGEQCNNDCPMCSNSGRPEAFFIKADELMRRLDHVLGLGARGVYITGGEPTIHPAFWKVVDRARELGMRWRINTHGRTFADPAQAARAVESGVNLAIISLHSHVVETSCAIFGVSEKGHHETIAGIREMVERGADVVVNCVVTSLNAPHLAEFVRYCAATFGRRYELKVAFPNYYGKGALWPGVQIRYSEVRESVGRMRQAAREEGVAMHFEAFPNCVLGDELAVNRGRSGCSETHYLEDVGGAEMMSIPFIESQLTAYPAQCLGCRAYGRCPGVAVPYLEKFGGAELVPFKS